MTQSVDISQLSVQQLLSLREDIDSQMLNRQQAELDKLRADILELCSSQGYTLQQVLAPLRKKSSKKAPANGPHFIKGKTYVNPANAAQTWHGFGQRPTWVRDHLAKGGTAAELARPTEPADGPAEATVAPPMGEPPASPKPAAKAAPKKPADKPAAKKAPAKAK